MKRGYSDYDEITDLFDTTNIYDEHDEYDFLTEGAACEIEDVNVMKRAIDRYRRYIKMIYFDDDIVYIKEMILDFLDKNDFKLINRIDNSILEYINRPISNKRLRS